MTTGAGPADELRELRRRLSESSNGSGVELDRAELVARLSPGLKPTDGDDPREVARYAQRLLIFHGLRARPRVDDEQAARTTIRLDRGLAIQGAAVITVLAALVGAAGSMLYGLLLGLAGLIAIGIVWLAFDRLAARAPDWLPRGRTLGVAVALPLVLLMLVAVVIPIRASRSNEHNPGFARSLLDGARQSLAAGDVKSAEDRVVQASFADPGNPDLANVREQIVVARVQQMFDEQSRKEGIYDQAERANRKGQTRQAIRLMSQVRGFRDADQRLADFRAGRD